MDALKKHLWGISEMNVKLSLFAIFIFPTQGLNPGLPHFTQILYYLSHQQSPNSKTLSSDWRWTLGCNVWINIINTDIPKFIWNPSHLVCPDIMLSVIIVVIILTCYMLQKYPSFLITCTQLYNHAILSFVLYRLS